VSIAGTAAYDGEADLPPLVALAVEAARRAGFANSCLPAQGRLLRLLAGGVGAGVIGETGTGCGVGLAWLASGADPGARLVSVEREPSLAAVAAEVFAADPRVEVRAADWRDLRAAGPFDLLVLDGGGQGKAGGRGMATEAPLDPEDWLRPGGLVVLDDFTPATAWPPMHGGRPDTARLRWLSHRWLRAAEIRIAPDAATIVASYLV
jgi:predicted O-methyltransferase YrrM